MVYPDVIDLPIVADFKEKARKYFRFPGLSER
jgi:hypothetical protein